MFYTSRMTPLRFLAEEGAVQALEDFMGEKNVFIVSGRKAWTKAGIAIQSTLERAAAHSELVLVGRQCYMELAEELAAQAHSGRFSWIIGVGGGKVMDLVKITAELAGLPCALIPTTPTTCSSWSALSVVYDAEGNYLRTYELAHCPDLTILDYSLLTTAPRRHLASGMLDALAKWYEISSHAGGAPNDPAVVTALANAKLCRDQIFALGKRALEMWEQDPHHAFVQQAIWYSIAIPGLTSGMVGKPYRFSVAHSFYNNLTHLRTARETSLHGEQVAFGLAAQMLLAEPVHPEYEEFRDLWTSFQAPITLEKLGIRQEDWPALERIIARIAAEPRVANLPFPVSEARLQAALLQVDRDNPVEK